MQPKIYDIFFLKNCRNQPCFCFRKKHQHINIHFEGGLSTGLEESGAAKVLWAIECDEQAAKATHQIMNKHYNIINIHCS